MSSTSSLQRTLATDLGKKQLQQNLSTDQQQLQDRNFSRQPFSSSASDSPASQRRPFNKELATTFAKKSLAENLVFQNFFFDNLAFQKTASGEVVEKTFQKKLANSSFTQTGKEACKEQLLPTGFPAASANQQLFSNSLVQQSGAKGASHRELLPRELPEEQLADKTFLPDYLGSNQLAHQNFSKTASGTGAFSQSAFSNTAFSRTA